MPVPCTPAATIATIATGTVTPGPARPGSAVHSKSSQSDQAHGAGPGHSSRVTVTGLEPSPERHREEYSKCWRESHPGERRRSQYARYQELRNQIFNAYGWHCACCRRTEPEELSVAVPESDGTYTRPGRMSRRSSGPSAAAAGLVPDLTRGLPGRGAKYLDVKITYPFAARVRVRYANMCAVSAQVHSRAYANY